jgi:hypothetical protein
MPVDPVLAALGSLLGVIVGGLVTYFVTTAAEKQRWRQEKADRLALDRRAAVSKALGWLDPMDLALSTASMSVTSLLQLNLEHQEFRTQYPHLVSDLAKMDVPPDLRLLLPASVYSDGHRILRAFEEIRTAAIRWGQEARMEKQPMLGLHECGPKIDALRTQIAALREKLEQAYLATYE